MERSKRINDRVVVRQELINGIWQITIADTQDTWWQKTRKKINDIIN